MGRITARQNYKSSGATDDESILDVTGTKLGTKNALDVNELVNVGSMLADDMLNFTSLEASYTQGDFMSAVTEIPNALVANAGTMLQTAFCIVDNDHTALAASPYFDLLIFESSPTIDSADGARLQLALSEVQKIVGRVNFTYGDFIPYFHKNATPDLIETAFKENLALPLQAVADATSLYGVLVAAADITFNSTDAEIYIKLGFIK